MKMAVMQRRWKSPLPTSNSLVPLSVIRLSVSWTRPPNCPVLWNSCIHIKRGVTWKILMQVARNTEYQNPKSAADCTLKICLCTDSEWEKGEVLKSYSCNLMYSPDLFLVVQNQSPLTDFGVPVLLWCFYLHNNLPLHQHIGVVSLAMAM